MEYIDTDRNNKELWLLLIRLVLIIVALIGLIKINQLEEQAIVTHKSNHNAYIRKNIQQTQSRVINNNRFARSLEHM